MRQVVSVFAFIFIALVSLPAAVEAIDFGGVSARPANPSTDDERTSAWFVYTLAPESKQKDLLTVGNTTDKEITVDVYPADSTPTSGNGFALKQRVEEMNGVGKWIALSTASVTLAPHQETTIPFTITIPDGIAPGLYAGGIMVAERAAPDKTGGVNIATRVGVRVYVTVVPRSALALKQKTTFPYFPTIAALILCTGLGATIVLRTNQLKNK